MELTIPKVGNFSQTSLQTLTMNSPGLLHWLLLDPMVDLVPECTVRCAIRLRFSIIKVL